MLHSRRRAQAMEEALKWYADKDNWNRLRWSNQRVSLYTDSEAMVDRGERARQALAVDPWDSCPAGHDPLVEDAQTEGCQR